MKNLEQISCRDVRANRATQLVELYDIDKQYHL